MKIRPDHYNKIREAFEQNLVRVAAHRDFLPESPAPERYQQHQTNMKQHLLTHKDLRTLALIIRNGRTGALVSPSRYVYCNDTKSCRVSAALRGYLFRFRLVTPLRIGTVEYPFLTSF